MKGHGEILQKEDRLGVPSGQFKKIKNNRMKDYLNARQINYPVTNKVSE